MTLSNCTVNNIPEVQIQRKKNIKSVEDFLSMNQVNYIYYFKAARRKVLEVLRDTRYL